MKTLQILVLDDEKEITDNLKFFLNFFFISYSKYIIQKRFWQTTPPCFIHLHAVKACKKLDVIEGFEASYPFFHGRVRAE